MFIEILLFSLLIFALWNVTKKPDNYPPGPWGLPIVGSIPSGREEYVKKIKQLRKEHGDIFSWRMGSIFLVFLNDCELIKETLQNVTFANRPDASFLSFLEDRSLGLVASNGPHWHENRRFSLRHLRDLGMGKSKIVSAVQFEASELVKVMKKQAGKAAPFPESLIMAVINVLWHMVASKRYEFDDQNILDLHNQMIDVQKCHNRLMLLDVFPWLKQLPNFLVNLISQKHKYLKVSNSFIKRFQGYIDEHKKTLDESNPRDFIDEYLIEMKKQESNQDSTMSEEDLVGCIADFFIAGMDTTSLTTIWSVFILATFPEVQKKIQKQIDSVLPNGALVTLEDKVRLPYVEAFLTEVLRYSSLVINGGIRTCFQDVKIGKYVIPKGVYLVTPTESIHFDPKYFDNPNDFNPERFLSSEGKFVAPKEGFFPFGFGKRRCLGESLSKMELFVFITTFLQNFTFSAPQNQKLDLSPADNIVINIPKRNQDIIINLR